MQITHCPECATAFKVSPEQLQLAQGWVRCGRCGAVFEALKHLEAAQSTSSVCAPVVVSEPTPKQMSAQMRPIPQEATSRASLDASDRIEKSEPSFDPSWREPVVAQSGRDAAASAVPIKMAWMPLALCVCLVFALVWQIILYKRDWLMAQEPALRGVLSVMCAPVGCEPSWPRLPESLQVESSSFTHDPQGFYSVQMRVKNTEHFSLAAPHLELTLVDVYDDVVLRRVFAPDELGLTSQMLPLRDARANLEFVLDAALTERVTGYRVLLFYP